MQSYALSGKKQFSANRVPVCMVRFLLWSHFKRTSDSSQLIKPNIFEFQKLSLSKRGKTQNFSCENEFYLHENRPYSRYPPSFHAFNWWDERKVTWFLTYLIRVLQYSFLNFALPSPLASLFRVVYVFHITWSGLVFQASPNLSSRRNYDQEGLGRRPYKNLENFCLMINNLRVMGGSEKILGVEEGRPKIPSSFAVMVSVSE